MKKICMSILCAVMAISFIIPCGNAAETGAVYSEVTYDNHDIIKEVAYAYDRQGAQILYDQLNARRHIYASPEDATAQRTLYLDCSSFVNSCYREAFGVNVMPYDITAEATGVSPNTVHFVAYAKENTENPDVVGYWENADYTTDEEKTAVMEEVRNSLEVGDLLVYRHGKTTASSGHVYIYVGDDTFLHCYGGGSYYRNEDSPWLSYDSSSGETTSGMIDTIQGATIFENIEHKRYLFKATDSDTVRNFCVLRPLARGLTPTEETLNRMKIAGLTMEKTASVYENCSVYSGDIITYTITLQNTASTDISNVLVEDIIPDGTEFVSVSDGVICNEGSLSWEGDVAAKDTVSVTYDVRVKAVDARTLIKSDSTYVGGVKLGDITHSVSGCDKTYGLLIGEKARAHAEKSAGFESGLSFAHSLYKSALGVELFSYDTVGEVLDNVIDVENCTCFTDTDVSKMIAPNLYGGYSIRYGWLYHPAQNSRTRLISESEMEAGDIILADWSGGSIAYVYIGNSTLATVEDGICKTLTIGENIYQDADNILISLLAYDRFAVLRPSMVNTASALSIEAIEISTLPEKLSYQSGEYFDKTGMTVSAVMSDGTKQEIKGYSVSPELLIYPEDSVTISFGDFEATVDISVAMRNLSVGEAALLDVGTSAKVEGIVAGVAYEGDGQQKEMLIKDTSSDAIIAVRSIPSSYGTYPNYGYSKGDKIVFTATVKSDALYTNKKYLEFSSDNGTIDTTIISSGNEITYSFDNVVTLDSWDVMKKFLKSSYAPYTYLKITGGSYLYSHSASVYRLHKNESATEAADIKLNGGQYLSVRPDVMIPNLGSDWTKLFFDEEKTGFPGTFANKDFYAVYIGGNNTYFQLVILDEKWVYDSEFAIEEAGEDGRSALVNLPKEGSYSVAFADYENNELENIDIVPVAVKENETGRIRVNMENETFTLGTGDKVMLLDNDLMKLRPMCENLKIE